MLCLVAVTVLADEIEPILDYQLKGLKGELKRNALAWLGDPPDSSQDRAVFLATSEQRLNDSLRALGYYNPTVTQLLKRTEPVWQLVITVDPGDPVLISEVSIELEGAAAGDPAFIELLATEPFANGDTFNHGVYERFKTRLLTLGQERGYFDAQLNESQVVVNAFTNQAQIRLLYSSGERFRFGAVEYGDSGLDPELLAELQPIQEGDYFDQAALQLFQGRLQETRFFSGVLIRPMFDQVSDSRVPLKVSLTPARRHSFDVGVGYSTDTEARISMVWRTPLINRYGHSQQTRIAYSQVNPSGRFVYTIPLSHPLDDVVRLSALLEDNEFGDIDSEQVEFGAVREIRGGKWLYSYSVRDLEETWDLKSTNFKNDYLLPGFSLARSDRVGPLVNPSRGFSQFYKVEGAGADLGSDIDLLRVTANFSYIFSLSPVHRFVARTALGAVFLSDDDRIDLAPSLGFFAGGSQSIRGYGYQSIGNEVDTTRDDGSKQTLVIGGDRLVTATLEYQYYFTETWRGAVFVDAGDAFDSTDFDVNVGPGFGIHYISPVGAVRVELANSATDNDPSWRLVLNIGAEF